MSELTAPNVVAVFTLTVAALCNVVNNVPAVMLLKVPPMSVAVSVWRFTDAVAVPRLP